MRMHDIKATPPKTSKKLEAQTSNQIKGEPASGASFPPTPAKQSTITSGEWRARPGP